MCLIITALCAALAWAACLASPAFSRKWRVPVLALMYSGATLMWICDGFWNLAAHKPFAELTANDALLGLCVAALGLVVWGCALAVKKPVA
jgi:hypothetical protein